MIDIFSFITRGKRLKVSDRQKGNIPFITAGQFDNGVTAYIDNPTQELFENSITIDMFGNAFYQNTEFKCDDNITVLKNDRFTQKIYIFIVSALLHLKYKYSYGKQLRPERLKDDKIKLPIKDENLGDDLENIDFKFMEDFITELEAQRITELEAYLIATNLKDYNLTTDEKQALKDFENLEWQEFKIGNLFEILKSKKAKKQNVRKYKDKEFNVPVVYCKFGDNGIMYWGRKGEFTTYENIISVVYNGAIATGKVYAQKESTGILAESYFIKLKNMVSSHKINLFFTAVLEKILYHKYSREYLATWSHKVENDFISLPVKKSNLKYDINNINFNFIENFIKAIEKLVIKDVVDFADEKISLTKKCIKTPCETK